MTEEQLITELEQHISKVANYLFENENEDSLIKIASQEIRNTHFKLKSQLQAYNQIEKIQEISILL